MTKNKHVHKLNRHKHKSGSIIYFCILPDCNYKVSPALALGKRSLCNRCGDEFILSPYSIRLAKPHCDNCHQPKVEDNKYVGPQTDMIAFAEPTQALSLSEKLRMVVNSRKPSFSRQEDEDEL